MRPPQRILKDLKEVFPEDELMFTDVGWNKNGVAQQFDITVPGSIHHSSGLATMGFGASAVLGGKVAAPDKICVALVDDGGFGRTPDGEVYSPNWAEVAKAYGVDAARPATADEFLPALKKPIEANKAGKPFLVEALMENIVVPTPGCWNINDIYRPSELVKEGKLVKDEAGRFVAPSHSKSHK